MLLDSMKGGTATRQKSTGGQGQRSDPGKKQQMEARGKSHEGKRILIGIVFRALGKESSSLSGKDLFKPIPCECWILPSTSGGHATALGHHPSAGRDPASYEMSPLTGYDERVSFPPDAFRSISIPLRVLKSSWRFFMMSRRQRLLVAR